MNQISKTSLYLSKGHTTHYR